MQADEIALQLYTVRERAANDFLGTLREVAGIGYRAVELAGYHGVPVRELRSALDDLGVRAMGAHVAIGRFETEPERVAAELRELGCDFAVVPVLPAERRRSGAEARSLAAACNRWGERFQAEGLTFAYHNHDFEFDALPGEDGRTLFDILLAETDPALVFFELDIYWAAHAGVDPLMLLERHAPRLPLLHLKDMSPGAERADAPVGTGTLAWEPLLATALPGTRWYVVEQDNPSDAIADVTTSFRNLASLVESA